jgi:GAF domain-containing protein
MTSHLSQRITSILDVDGLLSEVVELLRQNLGYYHSQILLRDEPGSLTLRGASGEAGEIIKDRGLRVSIDDRTIVGWVAHHGEALCANDVHQEARYRPLSELPLTGAEMGLPLRVGGEVIGVLDIHSDHRNAFDEDDQTILQMLGDQIAVAVQNATSYERALAQTKELAALSQLAVAIGSAQDTEEMLAITTRGIAEILDGEAGSVLLVDESGMKLEFAAALFERTEKSGQYRLDMGQGIAGWVAEHGQPLLVDDVTEDPRHDAAKLHAIGLEPRSILCVPLQAHDTITGVIEVINRLGRGGDTRFSQTDLQMLTALASMVAVALESVRLRLAGPLEPDERFKRTLDSITRSANEPLKVLATSTYALKAGLSRGEISCSGDTLAQLLDSMELRIEQMASLTQVLNEMASPESTADDWAELEQRLARLREKYEF